MPSELPKVTVYLKPETRAALDAAAEALGQSRSRIVSELLDSALPVLRAVTDAALVVRNAGDMQRQAMQSAADELEGLQGPVSALQAQVLDIMGRLGDGPPPSNRGVTN